MLTDLEQRNLDLVNEIERVTGDSNRAAWWELVAECAHQEIRVKLSEFKLVLREREVLNRGAYFHAMAKGE